ncbi:hypothetical protein HMSSN036_80010 [Paenibacillus macerans]|nr:hypothetical protein HMSSN036_80010 [Paenibacillus macerans]
MNQDWVSVTIRIDRSMMDKVIERFGEGNVIKVEGNTCLAAYPIIPNEFGYDKLLAFGDKCEIVGPSEVREGFGNTLGGFWQSTSNNNKIVKIISYPAAKFCYNKHVHETGL